MAGMTKCHCIDCSPEPSETYSERFRYTSECKWTARQFWNDLEEFEKHMAGVVRNRGQAEADRLRKGVEYLWGKVK